MEQLLENAPLFQYLWEGRSLLLSNLVMETTHVPACKQLHLAMANSGDPLSAEDQLIHESSLKSLKILAHYSACFQTQQPLHSKFNLISSRKGIE